VISGSPAGSTNRLINLSVSSFAGTAEQTLIAGFALRGAGTKPMLVRGIGPSLGLFGLTGFLVDPQLKLQTQGGDPIAENDNWANAPAVIATTSAVGAFPLLNRSNDAALVVDAGAALYTAQVLGANGGTGRASIELYDGTPDDTTLGLANLSARTQLAPNEVLIAGFVLRGTGNRAVLIRAVGPGLTAFGLGGTLADPKLELNNNSGKLFENDNWTTEIAPTMSRVGAFPLAAGSKDAALLVALPPGAYTALVRAGATGGVVLIELYDVP
jgi:hypothetical protein